MSPLIIVYSLQSAVGYPIFQKEYQMISTKMSFFWHPEHLIFWPEMATGLNEKWPKSCFFNQNGANFRPKKIVFWKSLHYLFKGYLEDATYQVFASQVLWMSKETHFCAKHRFFSLSWNHDSWSLYTMCLFVNLKHKKYILVRNFGYEIAKA